MPRTKLVDEMQEKLLEELTIGRGSFGARGEAGIGLGNGGCRGPG